jgi:hypothetical protein
MLVSLKVLIGDAIEPPKFLRSLLFTARLPALKNLTICIEHPSYDSHIGSAHYAVPMQSTEPPILSDAMARGLRRLTFRFELMSEIGKDEDLTITNWSSFQALFNIHVPSEVIRYAPSKYDKRLPKLL